MAIEVKEKRLLKGELPKVIDELFISDSEFNEKHMDFSHIDGFLYVKDKEKKIPYFKFKTFEERVSLRKDFSEFLAGYKIDEGTSGNQFILATVFLGMSDGRNRSFYLGDYKVLLPMIKKYVREVGTMALVVSHFSEKTSERGSEVEHIHILYKLSPKARERQFIGEYLEEKYEEE